jgi:hypothetical protein
MFETKILKPKKQYAISKKSVKYENAEKLALETSIEKNSRQFVIVNGTFIFGDFIEAFIIENKLEVEHLIVSSLSADQGNIDSLNNLIFGNWVEKLDLIFSTYFYGYQKNNMVKYIYDTLDNQKMQLSICDTHCKMVLIKTKCGKFFVIHGSANLPSSNNIEQFCIEESEELFNFNFEYQSRIIDKYKTINKSLRTKTLWQTVITEEKAETFTTQKDK